jgi:DNA-binding GntR family transcriptional regulator
MRPLDAQPQLVDRVYAALVEAIAAGELAPGEALVQERVAERLAVSRQPVVQALMQLKAQGFVEAGERRGFRVSRIDATTARRVYEVRGALDRLAARAAAERVPGQPAAAETLRRALEAGSAAVAEGSVQELIAADAAFHQTIYDLADNPLIAESAQVHWQHIRRVMAAVLRDHGQRATVWREHAAIAEAILAGDVARAGDLAEAHVAKAAEMLVGRLEETLALSA